ncbi:helix-turn-helix domain-containing protein [Bacillus solitudinis]|uniref:helix-turn-helix domain-containing protein n=1 Tax=Bacillus solitudinis TaxID=2014074 RepID=UPI000C2344AC|nr:helix-turn-helix domain-containing protein [Bacillus solitudinis]
MGHKKADVILHPVRMRIIQALMSYQKLTVQQLVEKLEDVPQATMYRHLRILTDAQAIKIVESNKVRGTIEKVYAVSREQVIITEKDITEMSSEDHLRYFMMYQANLLKEFEKYVIKHNSENFKQDGLGYWQSTLHLSDKEFAAFSEELKALLEKAAEKKPTPERKERTMATIFIPGV